MMIPRVNSLIFSEYTEHFPLPTSIYGRVCHWIVFLYYRNYVRCHESAFLLQKSTRYACPAALKFRPSSCHKRNWSITKQPRAHSPVLITVFGTNLSAFFLPSIPRNMPGPKRLDGVFECFFSVLVSTQFLLLCYNICLSIFICLFHSGVDVHLIWTKTSRKKERKKERVLTCSLPQNDRLFRFIG